MNIGFIGLGGMGRPMAEHLLAAGYPLRVWSRRRQAATGLLALGAEFAANPAALAAQCEIVCTNVTGDDDVLALAEELRGGLSAGAIHVDFSTISPASARIVAERHAACAVDFVDAPVSGGTAGARAATLAIMWGGKAELAARLQPLFACLAKTVVRVGDSGAGQVAKACNQLVMVAAIEACAEAAHLATAAGVDFARVRTALQGGSAASRVVDFFGDKMLRGDFAAGIEARLHHKDIGMIMAAATRSNIPLPIGSILRQHPAAATRGAHGCRLRRRRQLAPAERSAACRRPN
jgi:2-hydroxy-3-oxopropionate reductase